MDGHPVSWSNWDQHEPNIRQGKNCAYVENFLKFPKTWGWKLDNGCTRQRSFVCRLGKNQIFSGNSTDQDLIDENLGRPLDCPEGWKTHEGSWHCFKSSAEKQTLGEAKRQCRNWGAYLVTIYGENSNHFAQRFVRFSRSLYKTIYLNRTDNR